MLSQSTGTAERNLKLPVREMEGAKRKPASPASVQELRYTTSSTTWTAVLQPRIALSATDLQIVDAWDRVRVKALAWALNFKHTVLSFQLCGSSLPSAIHPGTARVTAAALRSWHLLFARLSSAASSQAL